PIVCITGQVMSKLLGTDAFQEVDITGITLPITKHNFIATRPEHVAPMIREAFQIAQSGRPGPVLVDITKDAQQGLAVFDFDAAKPRPSRPHPMRRTVPDAIAQAVELIRTAKKPVIFAGHGITLSAAQREVIEFAERLQIPVASTLLGLDAFPSSHALSLGMMGMHGEPWVNHAIQQADLLLAFGMRFDDRVTGNLDHYARHAKKIHIEIDPSEINKIIKVDIALAGDLKEMLQALLARIPASGSAQFKKDWDRTDVLAWIGEIAAMKGSAAVHDIINLPDDGHLYAAHVIHDIWREAVAAGRADQTIVVTDVGQHQMWEAQYFHHTAPRTLITSGGMGTMGFALPASIGAKMACPDKDVWCIVGDGGFQMTACELSTIVQEQLHINIAIINNGYLGMVRQWQDVIYEKNYACSPILSPDFVKLADAHGIAGAHVIVRKDVTKTVTKARTGSTTFLMDFSVEKEDGVYPMITPGKALHEMLHRPRRNPLAGTD
ncbi:MAG: thiamine pyrophosphate-dependent enzyme, partial [Acidobacteriaceae bacterium]|nr:thiamine pyrophosphate-dependent enzyme [Acidobacteriaceae bacterium]